MTENKIRTYLYSLLIAVEVFIISLAGYKAGSLSGLGMVQYFSLDVLYCLPIIQAARLTAIHNNRRYDTQAPTIVGILVAFSWSMTEAAIIWPDFPFVALIWNVFTRSVVFTVVGRVVIKLWREREYAYKDLLTNLASRLELLERIKAEQSRSERSGIPYSLLFIDIDHFKSMNDIYGHQVGDEALIVLATVLKESSRRADVAARLGGDEFILLMPDTDESSCKILINRIATSAQKAFDSRSWPISVSIGQATHIGKTHEVDLIIHLADENMYAVKKRKRELTQSAGDK